MINIAQNKVVTIPTYNPELFAFSALPFVGDNCKWQVEPEEYGEACIKGQEFALHLVAYLRDNYRACGPCSLPSLVASIDFSCYETKGYWIGFFEFLTFLVSESFCIPFNNDSF